MFCALFGSLLVRRRPKLLYAILAFPSNGFVCGSESMFDVESNTNSFQRALSPSVSHSLILYPSLFLSQAQGLCRGLHPDETVCGLQDEPLPEVRAPVTDLIAVSISGKHEFGDLRSDFPSPHNCSGTCPEVTRVW